MGPYAKPMEGQELLSFLFGGGRKKLRVVLKCIFGRDFLSPHTTMVSARVLKRFLLGTGRMPHPVGGAMGVTLCHCRERGYTRFDIILLNIHKATSLPGCCTLTSTADVCCLARHRSNCSTVLPKVFSRDLQVC